MRRTIIFFVGFAICTSVDAAATSQPSPKRFESVLKLISEQTVGLKRVEGVDEINSAAQGFLDRALYQEAEALFKTALEVAPNNHESLIGIADAYVEMGKKQEALEALGLAIKATAAADLPPAVEAARRLTIGQGLTKAGSYDAAHEQLTVAVGSAQDAKDLALGVRIYTAHAVAYTHQREFRLADRNFANAAELLGMIGDEVVISDLRRAFVMAQVGYELEQGQVRHAGSLLADLLDSGIKLGGHDIARISLQIGNALRANGEVDAAAPHIKAAVEIFKELLGPTHPDTLAAKRDWAALGSPI